MNILYICHEYPPARHGGIGSFVKSISKSLQNANHNIYVIGLCNEAEYIGITDDDGVYVERIAPVKHFPFSWKLDRKRLEKRVRALVKEKNIDLIEVTDYVVDNATWGKMHVPVIIRLHGSQIYFAKELGRPINNTILKLEQKAFEKADFICSVSEYTAQKTQIALSNNFSYTVIYNPIELQAIDDSNRPANEVIYTGTLTSKKGVIQLVKAWKQVLKDIPRAQLYIYGKDGKTDDGLMSMKEYLLSLLNEEEKLSVNFKGHINRDELLNKLKQTAIAVYPSYAEAFAIAPLEAMACGCATIYSIRGSGKELIDNGINGYLIEPDDTNQLAEQIKYLIKHPEKTREIGRAGKQHVDNNFSSTKLQQENISFYNYCINNFN